ncbi:MAG TPA: methyltransferase domain-containing protein [Acidimicrobiales bacterium]|nr:methyltransferase domain-containing protein [Acidimicrobiales bacterium]
MTQLDWGAGRYETTAEQLLPAARAAVAHAGLQAGERVLDLGCGTGNAALLMAAPGHQVTGVDPAPRLLDVARARAAEAGRGIRFLPGDAAAIPLGDSEIDVIVSVFALIFAPDPQAAAGEMARVLDSSGRIVLTAWIPAGAIYEMNSAAQGAVIQALGAPTPPPGFAWHKSDALQSLFGPHGFAVALEEHSLAFTAPSVEAFLESESSNHPMAVTGMAVLEQRGGADALRVRLREILEAGNEDPRGFRATSRYVVATAQR